MIKNLVLPILAIALTDVALQLDNAIAISSVASGVPAAQRLPVLAGGVLLAAGCLLTFTLTGALVVERLAWIKPIAAAVLVIVGVKLALEFFQR